MERYHANYNYENTGVTIVTSGKVDFKILKMLLEMKSTIVY